MSPSPHTKSVGMPRSWLLLNYGFLSLLVLVVAALGAWAYWGRIEESVTGMGHLVPEGQLRRLMAPRSGVVAQVLVRENQHVKKGEVLVVLDPATSAIDHNTAVSELGLLQGESSALRAAYAGQSSADSGMAYDAWLSAAQQANQGDMAVAEMQIQEAEHKVQEALARKAHLSTGLQSSEALLKQYQALVAAGGMSQNELQNFEQRVLQQRSEMAQLEEDIMARQAALTQAQQRPLNIQAAYQRDVMDRLSNHERQIVALAGDAAKTQVTLQQETIRAPIDGVVNEQAVRGPGEVVEAGSTLLSIVPDHVPLVAEIKVPNRELSYLHVNQRAVLKLDALPYQQFGRLLGTVLSISPSSIMDKEGHPMFVVRIKPDRHVLSRQGQSYWLTSGMTLTADLMTRERNLLSFLTEPVEQQLDQAFRDPTTR
jgi:HlyD family type I secretion membrane fusion protein